MPCGFDEAGAAGQIATLADRPEWQALRAVREGRVHPVDANGCFSRPGPRLVDGIERLARIFHGGESRPGLKSRAIDVRPVRDVKKPRFIAPARGDRG
jgi:iron complex transport system substrate-binding protein